MQDANTDINHSYYEEEVPSIEQWPLHDSDPAIHKASYKGDVALVTSLLDDDTATVDINTRNRGDCTPLHLAIRADHGSVIRILLKTGADPTLKDDIEPCYGVSLSALDLAAYLGKQNALSALIDHGLSIPASSLHLSASLNHAACLGSMLEKLGDCDFPNMSRLEVVRGAMNNAAQCWHVEAFDLLLDYYYKSFPDSVLFEGNAEALGKALILALYDYDCDDRCRPPVVCSPIGERLSSIMRSLVEAGADVNTREIEGRHRSAFWACLHWPTVPRDVVRFLLDNGLRVANFPPDEGSPLFGIICDANDDPSLVEDFIRAGASVTDMDVNGYTPLHSVAHGSFAEVLVANGADVSARTPQGLTPLHTACDRGNLSVTKLLLTHGVNVHDATSEEAGWTPLLFAAGEPAWYRDSTPGSRIQLVQLLHLHGADLNITALDGLTALHRAAECGNEELVRYLVGHDADVCATTTAGITPLHSACTFTGPQGEAQVMSIIRMLLEHGADLNATDEGGRTPLLIAVADCHLRSFGLWGFSPAVCNLLLEKGADKTPRNAEGNTVTDIVEKSNDWIFGDDGFVQENPHPVYVGSGGRGTGRGRGRGGPRRGA